MGLIKEPLDVDFVVDPGPLTKEEELAISEFIKADKARRKLKQKRAAVKKRKGKRLARQDRHLVMHKRQCFRFMTKILKLRLPNLVSHFSIYRTTSHINSVVDGNN